MRKYSDEGVVDVVVDDGKQCNGNFGKVVVSDDGKLWASFCVFSDFVLLGYID